jgi:hypothetical protein
MNYSSLATGMTTRLRNFGTFPATSVGLTLPTSTLRENLQRHLPPHDATPPHPQKYLIEVFLPALSRHSTISGF